MQNFLRWAGIVILVVSLVIGMCGFFALNSMSRHHASMDSEGGTFAYGMMSFFYLGGMFVGMLLGSVVWGIGILNRVNLTKIEKFESILQRIFLLR